MALVLLAMWGAIADVEHIGIMLWTRYWPSAFTRTRGSIEVAGSWALGAGMIAFVLAKSGLTLAGGALFLRSRGGRGLLIGGAVASMALAVVRCGLPFVPPGFSRRVVPPAWGDRVVEVLWGAAEAAETGAASVAGLPPFTEESTPL